MKKSHKLFLVILSLLILPFNAFAKPPIARIIDGTRVSATDYPYVAHLMIDGQTQCSGTLVGPKHVLTAGHCFFNDRNIQVVGDTTLQVRLGNQTYQSARVFINPAYVSRSIACVEGETDAAVIELSTPVNGVTPIKLLDSMPPPGSQLTLLGFGLEGTGSVGQVNRFPPDGQVNIGNTILEGLGDQPNQQNPNSSYFYWTFDPLEANTASGDSGGPAFYPVGNEFRLAGLTCGGEDNAQFGTLSFDTRADKIKSWVGCITGSAEDNTSPCLLNQSAVSAVTGKPFSFVVASGGTSPVNIIATGLPPGLSFDGQTISGTPANKGNFTVNLTAQNSFGSATSSLKIKISGFGSSLTIQKVLLQFDYQQGSRDFLDITGNVSVGKNFNPSGKKVKVQIGRFVKTFRLRSNGQSTSGNHNYFDLAGNLRNGRFSNKTVRYFLTLERLAIFNELATLGFPSSLNASQGEEVSLPLTVTIDGVEAATTVILAFGSSDGRWRIKQ